VDSTTFGLGFVQNIMSPVNFHLKTLQNCKWSVYVVVVVVVVVVVQEFEAEVTNTALELLPSVLKTVNEVRHGSSGT
jgi:hypothetical protein